MWCSSHTGCSTMREDWCQRWSETRSTPSSVRTESNGSESPRRANEQDVFRNEFLTLNNSIYYSLINGGDIESAICVISVTQLVSITLFFVVVHLLLLLSRSAWWSATLLIPVAIWFATDWSQYLLLRVVLDVMVHSVMLSWLVAHRSTILVVLWLYFKNHLLVVLIYSLKCHLSEPSYWLLWCHLPHSSLTLDCHLRILPNLVDWLLIYCTNRPEWLLGRLFSL